MTGPATSRLDDLTSIQARLADLPPHLTSDVPVLDAVAGFPGGAGDLAAAVNAGNALIVGLTGYGDQIGELINAVNDAARVPPPVTPEQVNQVEAAAAACGKAAAQCSAVADDLRKVAVASLPTAWAVSPAAELAAEKIGALSAHTGTIQSALQETAGALSQWSDDLRQWRLDDQRGVNMLPTDKFEWAPTGDGPTLHFYQRLKYPAEYEAVLGDARAGVAHMINAATTAMEAAAKPTGMLVDVRGMLQAAQPASHGDVTPLAAVVQAAARYPGAAAASPAQATGMPGTGGQGSGSLSPW